MTIAPMETAQEMRSRTPITHKKRKIDELRRMKVPSSIFGRTLSSRSECKGKVLTLKNVGIATAAQGM